MQIRLFTKAFVAKIFQSHEVPFIKRVYVCGYFFADKLVINKKSFIRVHSHTFQCFFWVKLATDHVKFNIYARGKSTLKRQSVTV